MDTGAFEAPVEEEVVAESAEPIFTSTETFELLAAPRGAPDDLAKLPGVGPQIVKKINEAGLFHYWQIAAMTDADVAKLDVDLKLSGRMARDKWVEHARTLLAG